MLQFGKSRRKAFTDRKSSVGADGLRPNDEGLMESSMRPGDPHYAVQTSNAIIRFMRLSLRLLQSLECTSPR
jgi:hypothetical protein